MLWLGKSDVHVTWEPESSLPTSVIKDFNDGIAFDAIEVRTEQYGLEVTTIKTQERKGRSQLAKRTRTEWPVIENSSG